MGSRVRRVLRSASVLALALFSAAAWSQQKEVPPSGYFGTLAGGVIPDSSRDADFGIGLHLLGGYSIVYEMAIEGNIFGQKMVRSSDNRADYSYGAGLDLSLGGPTPGSPIFLLGFGGIYEDLSTVKYKSPYVDLGIGWYLPFSFSGELWRIEARYMPVFNKDAYPPADVLEDVRLNFGILLGFGQTGGGTGTAAPAGPSVPVEPVPPPPMLPPPGDSDGDGVPDDQDRCPGTPAGVRVDGAGCTPDSDHDGVDDTKDACPNTPMGAAVDAQGCTPVPPPPPPAAVAPQPSGDEDGDGVPDDVDKCPHTAPGLTVDANGCVAVETVLLTNVHFAFNQDTLSDEGYRVLNSVAAALRQQPGLRIEVAGHADYIGSDKYNMELSRRRAETVRDFLTYLDIGSERLMVKAYGESRPIASNETDEGRALNRRVEFKMLNPEVLKMPAQ